MQFLIRLGVPEMLALWEKLRQGHAEGTLPKQEEKPIKLHCQISKVL